MESQGQDDVLSLTWHCQGCRQEGLPGIQEVGGNLLQEAQGMGVAHWGSQEVVLLALAGGRNLLARGSRRAVWGSGQGGGRGLGLHCWGEEDVAPEENVTHGVILVGLWPWLLPFPFSSSAWPGCSKECSSSRGALRRLAG